MLRDLSIKNSANSTDVRKSFAKNKEADTISDRIAKYLTKNALIHIV